MTFSVLHACDYNDVSKDGNYFRVFAKNTWLTKRLDKNLNKTPANFPRKFRLGKFHNPTTLLELCPILEALGNNPKTLVIRHKYTHAKINDTVVRKAKLVENVKSHIICMDIDELKVPPNLSNIDIAAHGHYVCNILHKCNPNIFPDDMGFIAQGSSSAGLTDCIKLHLWLQNSHKIEQAQLRNLFSIINSSYKAKFEIATNLIDPALYHDIQAHYTSYPVFEDSTVDPLKGKRMYYHFGSNSRVPEFAAAYVKPIATTMEERSFYLDSITGGIDKNLIIYNKIESLRAWKVDSSGFRNAVISLYHSAIQSQYSLKELEKELVPIIEGVRPGSAQEYIRQGKLSAINNIKACSVRELPTECLGLKLDKISSGTHEKYLDIQKHIPKNTVTFLKATLGSGKTYNVERWLKTGQIPGKFLAITDTSALVESNTARFSPARDFRSPTGCLDFASGEVDRLSGTLHSLLKIKHLTNSFDFLFIDEADSLMNNLLFASIIKEDTKIQIAEVLSELLQNTDRVVISDGDISEETVAQYINLMEGSRKLCRIDHKRQNLKNIPVFKHTKESSLWGALQGHLEIGDKCLLVSDSSPKALNEYLIAFDRVLPDKNIKVIHSSSKLDKDVDEIVNHTSAALRRQEIDALFCSPSITNGVDFNYFDTVFVLTNTENHTPNMRYQAMMRERDPKEIHYYFRDMKVYSTGYADVTVDKGFTIGARKAYAARREREYKTYIATFNYYLVQAGAKIQVMDTPYLSPIDKTDRENYLIERVTAILGARSNINLVRHNDAYEAKPLLTFYYDIEGEPSWEDAERFIKEKPNEKAEFFHKIYRDFGEQVLAADPKALMFALRAKGHRFYLATGESIHGIHRDSSGLKRAKQVLKRCGVGKDSISLISWYRKYCEQTVGVELPKEFNPNQEPIQEL